MPDPNGGIQLPISPWWDLPGDDVGPWWVLPGVGAPVHVRRADGISQSLEVQGSERFRLERRMTPANGLRVGDTVVWIQSDPDEQGEDNAVYPQQVIRVQDLGEGQDVWTLVDALLSDRGEFPLEGLPRQRIEAGQVTRQQMRQLLEIWQLNVICPVCASPGQQVQMGMPAGPPESWVDQAGCVLIPGEPINSYRCIRCETKWSVTEAGDVCVSASDYPIPSWASDHPNRWLTGESTE